MWNGTARKESSQAAKVREVKQWVREILGLTPEITILVTELTCSGPGCPPVETVIAVLRGPDGNVQHKIHRALSDVTRADVAEACARKED